MCKYDLIKQNFCERATQMYYEFRTIKIVQTEQNQWASQMYYEFQTKQKKVRENRTKQNREQMFFRYSNVRQKLRTVIISCTYLMYSHVR